MSIDRKPGRARWLLSVLIGTVPFVAAQAHADWPLGPDATVEDMKDPDNWPNDPSNAWTPDG